MREVFVTRPYMHNKCTPVALLFRIHRLIVMVDYLAYFFVMLNVIGVTDIGVNIVGHDHMINR